MSNESSNASIMSVGEMIDTAFGEHDVNVVNHKLIQTILYILARQLRLLERRVEVEIGHALQPTSSSLSITEVKMHALQKKKAKPTKSIVGTKGEGTAAAGKTTGVSGKGQPAKGTPGAGTPQGQKPMKPPTSDKTSSDRTYSDKTSSDKTSTDKTSSSDKTSSGTKDKTSSEKTSSDKTSSGKTSSDKTSSMKTSSDKTSSDMKTSSDKTSSDKTSSDKTSTDKTSSDKTSSDKTSSDKTSTEKSTTDKTTSDKTSSDKTSSDKTSSDKTSSKDKTSSDIPAKSTTDKASSTKDKSTISSSAKKRPEDYIKLLEDIEVQRETELRIIHQRADSREEHDKTPTPMASMDSVEATYEKLLVVERLPADEAKAIAARGRSGSRSKVPRLSVVTQEQFAVLARVVRQLQAKFGAVGSATFPENAQLMEDLRKGASLTDAMAALQLSARLEATEKTLQNMLSIVTQLASQTSGIDLLEKPKDDMQVIFGKSSTASQKLSSISRKSTAFPPPKPVKEPVMAESVSEESVEMFLPMPPAVEQSVTTQAKSVTTVEEEKDRVTFAELNNAIEYLHDEIMGSVNSITTKSNINADNAFKLASRLEGKLNASLNLGNRMGDLENLVSAYAEQINILDTGLSSQMTNYQDELTQMQHDLETGLETMAEVLANAGGDTTAVAELNQHFTNLQSDIDNTTILQKELKDTQDVLAFDLDALRKQIEILRETKSDRDEVADALRDKAGLGALNGLVSLQQFDAVRGDMEKRIGSAYDKFNSQEIIWQKVIDDVLRELNEKADLMQVLSLKDEVSKHLNNLRHKLNAMMEIVGEPRAAAVAKKIHRETACLSCATPAQMELEELGKVPALPAMRQPAVGDEAPKEAGDHGLCYAGFPIPHPRDPRAHVCQRWCGGSHTMLTSATLSRAPVGMILTPMLRQPTTALGTDGKLYVVDDRQPRPCAQCLIPKPSPQTSVTEQVVDHIDADSDMTPADFKSEINSVLPQDEISITPPPPVEDF